MEVWPGNVFFRAGSLWVNAGIVGRPASLRVCSVPHSAKLAFLGNDFGKSNILPLPITSDAEFPQLVIKPLITFALKRCRVISCHAACSTVVGWNWSGCAGRNAGVGRSAAPQFYNPAERAVLYLQQNSLLAWAALVAPCPEGQVVPLPLVSTRWLFLKTVLFLGSAILLP